MGYWLAAYLLGNLADVLTTYLALFRLPQDLQAEEGNPVFASNIRTRFITQMLLKMVLAALIGLTTYHLASLFTLKWLTFFIWMVVLNNTWVFTTRKVTGKTVPGPVGLLQYAGVGRTMAVIIVMVALLDIGFLLASI
jgi:hypothetical protein